MDVPFLFILPLCGTYLQIFKLIHPTKPKQLPECYIACDHPDKTSVRHPTTPALGVLFQQIYESRCGSMPCKTICCVWHTGVKQLQTSYFPTAA